MSIMHQSMRSVESLFDVPVEQAVALDSGRLQFEEIDAGTSALELNQNKPAVHREKSDGVSTVCTIIKEAIPTILLVVFIGLLMVYTTFFKQK